MATTKKTPQVRPAELATIAGGFEAIQSRLSDNLLQGNVCPEWSARAADKKITVRDFFFSSTLKNQGTAFRRLIPVAGKRLADAWSRYIALHAEKAKARTVPAPTLQNLEKAALDCGLIAAGASKGAKTPGKVKADKPASTGNTAAKLAAAIVAIMNSGDVPAKKLSAIAKLPEIMAAMDGGEESDGEAS